VAKRWDPFQEQQQFKAEGWPEIRQPGKCVRERLSGKREKRRNERKESQVMRPEKRCERRPVRGPDKDGQERETWKRVKGDRQGKGPGKIAREMGQII
jgi:hypothetical protein